MNQKITTSCLMIVLLNWIDIIKCNIDIDNSKTTIIPELDLSLVKPFDTFNSSIVEDVAFLNLFKKVALKYKNSLINLNENSKYLESSASSMPYYLTTSASNWYFINTLSTTTSLDNIISSSTASITTSTSSEISSSIPLTTTLTINIETSSESFESINNLTLKVMTGESFLNKSLISTTISLNNSTSTVADYTSPLLSLLLVKNSSNITIDGDHVNKNVSTTIQETNHTQDKTMTIIGFVDSPFEIAVSSGITPISISKLAFILFYSVLFSLFISIIIYFYFLFFVYLFITKKKH
jgi:hypothetical protein